MNDINAEEQVKAAYAEMESLRHTVSGVLGSVIAGVDGLLILHDLGTGPEPHDLAALAAATFGLGRQTGLALRHGPFRESTVRSLKGYFSVYAIGDSALLAVLGGEGLNIARLHIEARGVTSRLTPMVGVHLAVQSRL
ncbi:roadblock/LC7 domain-containing protein [Phytohabitans rumicis]|uniref:roadblock/LC7 domain-containing protein n=1 Tax=Phytohabitans rumicis TaxID=1076125 RepID=UPI0031E8DB31